MKLDHDRLMSLRHSAYEMKKDILFLCHKCGTQKAHLGGCLSAVDILNVLYTDVMNLKDINIKGGLWQQRDRFIMSKGHAGIAMYAALKQAGVIDDETLKKGIRGEDTILYRHPKFNPRYAIECSVGSLGMGIGYGVGLAEIAKRNNYSYNTYVMLGDGECDEGAVWESLAYASHRKLSNFTVVIDKNGLQLDGKTTDVLDLGDITNKMRAFGYKAIEVDGHNYEELLDAFHISSDSKPKAIIAYTKKGKGMSFAENRVEWHDNYLSDLLYERGLQEIEAEYTEKEKYLVNQVSYRESIKEFDDDTSKELPCIKQSYSEDDIKILSEYGCKEVIGYISEKIADCDDSFVLTYSDCAKRIGIESLIKKHPSKCLEMGIAEQNQLAVSSAFAHNKYHVYSIAYAPFITARVLDQIRSFLGYMKSPVKLIGLTAGFSASDLGATHTALEDIANMRAIPNMIVVCPADCLEIAKVITSVVYINKPVYIRITAPINSSPIIYKKDYQFSIGKAVALREGNDIAIIGCGSILSTVLECAEDLDKGGMSTYVINMHTIKPLDTDMLDSLMNFQLIVTVEEHSVIGGLGAAVSEYVSQFKTHPPVLKIGVPDMFYVADFPYNEYKRAGLTKEQIKESIINSINND